MELPPINVDLSAINVNLSKSLEFHDLQRKIKPLFSILGKTATTTLEKVLCSEDEDVNQDDITTNLIMEAKKLQQELHATVQEKESEAFALFEKIQIMWKESLDKKEFDLGFTNGRIGIINALKNLQQEQLAANAERELHIQEFIVHIRGEIMDLWKQCMASEEEKQQFLPFVSTSFDEDTLELHKLELAKLKNFHEKNQVLFKKVANYLEQRKVLWQTMKELQAKLEDPNKYTNRGATLLNNQKEMNCVTSRLPKLEEALKKLAIQFEKENGRKLLIKGQSISQIFDNDWAEYKSATSRRFNRPAMNTTIMSATPGMILRTAEKRVATGSRLNLITPAAKRLKQTASVPDLNLVDEQENSS